MSLLKSPCVTAVNGIKLIMRPQTTYWWILHIFTHDNKSFFLGELSLCDVSAKICSLAIQYNTDFVIKIKSNNVWIL